MISDYTSLEVKITQDGNKWCALSGKDLQEGNRAGETRVLHFPEKKP